MVKGVKEGKVCENVSSKDFSRKEWRVEALGSGRSGRKERGGEGRGKRGRKGRRNTGRITRGRTTKGDKENIIRRKIRLT